MAWYNPLSWGEKVATDVLDKDTGILVKVGSWINEQNLTDEEVILHNAKTITSVQEFVKATLDESTHRSRSRRYIAKIWIEVQLGIVLVMCIAAPWNLKLAEFYFNLATSSLMAMGTGAIIIFHFGSYGLARHNQTRNIKKD